MEEIVQKKLTGERALFGKKQLLVTDCIFEDGESPLKECREIALEGCMFKWKYPIWYSKDITVKNCTWFEMARAGVWYTNEIAVEHALIQAPKNFRRCDGISLADVTFTNAAETMWHCKNVKMNRVTVARGDYFAMDSENMEIDGLTLDGNYSFDGASNVVIRNSRLLTKDAFWNSDSITVYDSFISGEYLGWNSKRLTLVNCTIESLQGMCYIDNLVLKNCKLLDTTLAFEYAQVEAELSSGVESVFNPKAGTITADWIGELILEKDIVSPEKTKLVCKDIRKTSDRPEWKREGKDAYGV